SRHAPASFPTARSFPRPAPRTGRLLRGRAAARAAAAGSHRGHPGVTAGDARTRTGRAHQSVPDRRGPAAGQWHRQAPPVRGRQRGGGRAAALPARRRQLSRRPRDRAGQPGPRPGPATMQAVRDRLRPTIMTSLAFGLGVLPLAIASGAGSGAQRAIGTGVLGGMIVGTFLGVFFIPLFFLVVERIFNPELRKEPLVEGEVETRE